MNIDLTTVRRVYSGRLGCMCGCNGKYTYSSGDLEAASKERGYPVGPEDVSDRSVRTIVNKVKKLIETNDPDLRPLEVVFDPSYVFVQATRTRCYCIYFK